MHQFLKFILFWNNTLHVSDGLSVHHQEFKTVHTATGICQTDTATCLLPVAVCTVFNSWWWTERPSETCRVLFQNKINLRYCASDWFYYRNILRCTVLWTSNLKNMLRLQRKQSVTVTVWLLLLLLLWYRWKRFRDLSPFILCVFSFSLRYWAFKVF